MNIVDYLKNKRKQLLDAIKQEEPSVETKMPPIEIVIENSSGQFENEEEIIMQGAQEFFKNGVVESLEDGVITTATMLRGLRYLGKESTEDGTIRILFRDNVLENEKPKTL